jgi:cation diffusion facilitator family transporter
MIGVKLAARQADNDHEYGHERLECIAALLLAVVLALTGVGIGWSGIQKMMQASYGTLEAPGLLALVAAIISIGCKEAMYWYTRNAAKKADSSALMADAWHHRSDALSSVGSLIGIAGARMGFPILDPLASLVICLFILKVSYDIFRESVKELTDRSCPASVEKEMREVIVRQEGVKQLDLLHTRQFASRIYVDVEISADGSLTLYESHDIAQRVHDIIEKDFPRVKHCMVHVNPTDCA